MNSINTQAIAETIQSKTRDLTSSLQTKTRDLTSSLQTKTRDLTSSIQTKTRDFTSSIQTQTRNLKPEAALYEITALHLRNVYSLLFASIIFAAIGSCFNLGGFLSSFITFGLTLYLHLSSSWSKVTWDRLSALLLIGFSLGSSIHPLLSYAIAVDSRLVFSALIGTALVFLCFSIAAMIAPRRSYLYLGGYLSSALTTLVLAGIVTRLLGGYNGYLFISVFGGLLLFAGFVIYDTDKIISKIELHGTSDAVTDSLELFLDFVNIFVRILIIILRNYKKNNESSSSSSSSSSSKSSSKRR